MKLHLIGIFHTVAAASYSHCAFTGKVLRFPAMLRGSGYEIIEYGNEGSESEADRHVVILGRATYQRFFGSKREPSDFVGNLAQMGSVGHAIFEGKLLHELKENVAPGDFVLHPFGKAHGRIIQYLPEAIHVESGIGYSDEPVTAWRIFESETWRHHHFGLHLSHPLTNYNSTFVCPNYFDPTDWPLGTERRPIVVYLARRDGGKGIFNFRDIVIGWHRAHPGTRVRFHVAGQGAGTEAWKGVMREIEAAGAADLVVDRGVLVARARAQLLGEASILVAHTQFVEPFGGACAEAMLCGTPVVGSDFGVYVEHIENGVTGFRARNLTETLATIGHALGGEFDNVKIREIALSRWSYDAVRPRYMAAFEEIQRLHARGWLG